MSSLPAGWIWHSLVQAKRPGEWVWWERWHSWTSLYAFFLGLSKPGKECRGWGGGNTRYGIEMFCFVLLFLCFERMQGYRSPLGDLIFQARSWNGWGLSLCSGTDDLCTLLLSMTLKHFPFCFRLGYKQHKMGKIGLGGKWNNSYL